MPFLNPDEVYRIALHQAKRQAEQARVNPDLITPTPDWPFRLTEDDKTFLRSLLYPISPA